MTGKDLKEFASKLHDEAIISVRERSYGAFTEEFQLQATMGVMSTTMKEESHD